MTYAGTRGKSASQMEQVLHLPSADKSIHPVMEAIRERLLKHSGEKHYELRIANALWCQKGHRFQVAFLMLSKKYYRAGLMEEDFRKDPEGTRRDINNWFGEQTNNKIQGMVAPGEIDASLMLVLTSAIYFKGSWEKPFNEKATRPGTFWLASGDKTKVPMMHETGKFRYMEGEEFKAIELFYKGRNFSMVILLPSGKNGLSELETKLTYDNLHNWIGSMQAQRVIVEIPRFTIRSRIFLKKTLWSLGMKDIFSPGVADFSGMDGTRDLFISKVIHEAVVEVNERGTEAAAASSIAMSKAGHMLSKTKFFCANRPFFFMIRHIGTGSVLFLGRLNNPNSQAIGNEPLRSSGGK